MVAPKRSMVVRKKAPAPAKTSAGVRVSKGNAPLIYPEEKKPTPEKLKAKSRVYQEKKLTRSEAARLGGLISGGNNKIRLNKKQLQQLEAMAGEGLNHKQIGSGLGFSKTTLEKICKRDEKARLALERGKLKSDREVVNAAFTMAKSGISPALTIFWLKARCGWRENLDITTHDGTEEKKKVDLSKLSEPELKKLRELMGKAKVEQTEEQEECGGRDEESEQSF